MESDDLPKDLTFNDPAINPRPVRVSIPSEPKSEVASTPLGKLRDFVIGVILLLAFFAAIWGLSLLITGGRGK
jgi:hypothetical protein